MLPTLAVRVEFVILTNPFADVIVKTDAVADEPVRLQFVTTIDPELKLLTIGLLLVFVPD